MFCFCFFAFRTDRVNEFSDEDEEIEFSSGEYDPNNIGGNGSSGGYACKHDMRKYRKIDQTENDGEAEDGALGSDSEFENLKEKGSRAKISHVSCRVFLLFFFLNVAGVAIADNTWSTPPPLLNQKFMCCFFFFRICSKGISSKKSFRC